MLAVMQGLQDAEEHRLGVADARVRVITAGSGTPVVFFDSGLGVPLECWSLVAPEVSRDTTVILWDRPGVGQSSGSPLVEATAIADAIEQLLVELCADEVVTVGHSRGGLNTLAHAARHPRYVRGLTLVEPSYPDRVRHMAASEADPMLSAARAIGMAPSWLPRGFGAAVRFGARLGGQLLSPGEQLMAEMAPLVLGRLDGLVTEHAHRETFVAGVEVLLAGAPFPSVPIVVITGDKNDDADGSWAAMHDELAALSPLGVRWHADCGHDVPFARPEIVIGAITELVSRAE